MVTKLLFSRTRVCARNSLLLGTVLALLVSVAGGVMAAPEAGAASKLDAASTPTGYGLAVDGATSLAVSNGCSPVLTDTRAAMASIAVSAVGGAVASTVTIGTSSWTVQPGQTFTTVQWVTLDDTGSFSACFTLADLQSESLQLLANTILPTSNSPGGLINVSARIPLVTSGTTSGQWTIPPDATPSAVGGLLLEVSSSTADVVQVTSGSATVPIAVGPGIPASTVVLPAGTPSWTDESGIPPDALLLGFITDLSDGVTGGALLNMESSPFKASGSDPTLAGKGGLPALAAQIPATSVLVNATGADPAVEDPLAAGRQTPSGAEPKIGTQSFLRIANDGRVHFTSAVHLTVIGWLAGDVIEAPGTVNLTLPGSPRLTSPPTSTSLVFAGQQTFGVGAVLVIGVSKETPNGLIAIVDAVTTGSHTTTVTYHTGALLNAFIELTIIGQIPAAPSGVTPNAAYDGNRLSTLAPINQTAFLGFSSSKPFQLGTSISGSVSFDFDPSVTLAITVGTGWLGLPSSVSLHFAVDNTTSVTGSLTASAGASASANFTLAKISLTPFDLGPIVVVPQLSASLSVSASIEASVTLTATVSEHAHVGMTMDAGIDRPDSVFGDSNNGFSAPSSSSTLSGSVSAQAQATLTLEFALLAYGEIGPDAQASATLAFDVNPQSSPQWEVIVSGGFSIGINLNALNISLLNDLLHLLGIPSDPGWAIGHLGPWVVASGGNGGSNNGGSSSGGGGPSPGSGSGPGGTSGSGGGGGGSTTSAPPGASVTVSQGPAAPYGYRYAIALTGFDPNSSVGVECYDSQDPGGFYYFTLGTDGSGDASTSSYCYSATGPDYWVVAGGLMSNEVTWSTGGSGTTAGAAVAIGWSASYPGWIYMTLSGFPSGSYEYTCQFASGGDASFTIDVTGSPETFDNGKSCYDLEAGDTVSVSVDSVQSNSIIVGGTPPQKGTGETTGGVTNTWTDYSDAGGSEGPPIQSNETVAILCRVQGFAVADGNTWWYAISSNPWNGAYYASADAFYNNGQTSGSLIGTPFVDTSVPLCNPTTTNPPPSTYPETTGGVTNTWTNYTNAGGYKGPQIPSNTTVDVTCALQGFTVADGNKWWYQIGSAPWSNLYYASADAFYNEPGVTTGSLLGTPFVDPAVPLCGSGSGYSETTGGPTNTWTDYSDAGGSQGPTIGSNATVQVACAVQGFAVADGNTWWYRIASSPWSNAYYASADAFYNEPGVTSGSLVGTPFVDPAVPQC